ncbi:MAG: pilus assembly protein [Actinomycetota bacterium]|nr:pilus assembly protein [Actinomycetota bacterium]
MSLKPSAIRRRRRDERGVVAVEAALVLPMVVLLIFGMVEFSLLLRDYVSLTAATRAGTRLASAEAGAGAGTCDPSPAPPCTPASSPKLAQDAADAMQRALTGVPNNSIDYVLIYRANGKGYPCASPSSSTGCNADVGTTMPTTCSGYNSCVMFTWNATKGAFRYASGSWDSTLINACVNGAAQDSVGIYLKVTHKWMTGLFGSTISINDRSVSKFEPLSVETCSSTSMSPHP